MTDGTDVMAQVLFNKPSLQACSLQQVDYLAHQYPYFIPAQLLLLRKTDPDAEAYTARLQRTALHAAQPMQLHYWLQPTSFDTELPRAELFQKPMRSKQIGESAPIEETREDPEITTVEAPEETATIPTGTSEDAVSKKSEPENLEIEANREMEIAGTPARPDVAIAENVTIVEQAETKPEAVAAEQSTTPLNEAVIETAASPAPQNKVQTELSSITFEPYHTVDYFASQGIKLSQQEATNDTLGKQLKSFTEWLKTMKRLPEATAAQPTDNAGERKVEHLAAHSLDTSDVVTESMAEVWLKQGNTAKAVEVYTKLSLHHPSKSAYFAAKIDSLKKG